MAMSVLEPASFGAGVPSTSSCIPPERVAEAFEYKRTTALRQSIRGMEAELVDLVFHCSSKGRFMDWLRVPLECAVAAGNLALVKRLLAGGVKTETPPERLRPAPFLHKAAEMGHECVVEELLKVGVDVHEKDSARHDTTALHCAAATGSEAAVRALTSAGANIDGLDARGWAPLHLACMYGHRGVVVFLLLNGACAQKGFPLHLAAVHNHPGVIEDLLSFGNVSVGGYDKEGRSALHVAAYNSSVEVCLVLLRGGAAIDRASSTGFSCLDIAAVNGRTGQMLQVLTAADTPDARKRKCSMSLSFAVGANQPDTIRDLVALGADVGYDRAGRIPYLHYSAVQGTDRAAEALLRAGANVNAMLDGRTPLHYACSRSHAGVVQVLLHWGADENASDFDGITASEIVGTYPPNPNEEILPEQLANKIAEGRIRKMLKTAPEDRSWRRRGWLVLCRARWSARIGEGEKRSSARLEFIADGATGGKKRLGTTTGPALVVKPREFFLDKGKARGGRHLPEGTTATVVLRLGAYSILSDSDAGQAAGAAGRDGRPRFVAVVERLLLLREDSIFREIVTFL